MLSHGTSRRSGSIYLMALGGSMIVAVAGISAVLVLRVSQKSTESGVNFASARFLARSAVELGQWEIQEDANWRNTKLNGIWRPLQALGQGQLSLVGIDPDDGSLSNDRSGRVLLTGTGIVGSARYKLAVELEPQGPPGMDCLASAIHSNLLLTVNSSVSADAPISSNGTINVGLTGSVNCDIEVVSEAVLLGSHQGSLTTGITPKETPRADVFDYYVANAVPISVSALPINLLLQREIRNQVISPGSNPDGGPKHPQGMYLLDCRGTPIVIRDSRIHGTLVILDPGLGSEIRGNISWERYDPILPALVVRGSIGFSWSGSLSESTLPSTNYNPSGSPYNGVVDTDRTDNYPARIKGLILVSEVLDISGSESIEGTIITQGLSMTINRPFAVTHDPTIILSPPPGFAREHVPMAPVEASWRQVVD